MSLHGHIIWKLQKCYDPTNRYLIFKGGGEGEEACRGHVLGESASTMGTERLCHNRVLYKPVASHGHGIHDHGDPRDLKRAYRNRAPSTLLSHSPKRARRRETPRQKLVSFLLMLLLLLLLENAARGLSDVAADWNSWWMLGRNPCMDTGTSSHHGWACGGWDGPLACMSSHSHRRYKRMASVHDDAAASPPHPPHPPPPPPAAAAWVATPTSPNHWKSSAVLMSTTSCTQTRMNLVCGDWRIGIEDEEQCREAQEIDQKSFLLIRRALWVKFLAAKVNQHHHQRASRRMNDKWSGNNYLLGCSSPATHGG